MNSIHNNLSNEIEMHENVAKQRHQFRERVRKINEEIAESFKFPNLNQSMQRLPGVSWGQNIKPSRYFMVAFHDLVSPISKGYIKMICEGIFKDNCRILGFTSDKNMSFFYLENDALSAKVFHDIHHHFSGPTGYPLSIDVMPVNGLPRLSEIGLKLVEEVLNESCQTFGQSTALNLYSFHNHPRFTSVDLLPALWDRYICRDVFSLVSQTPVTLTHINLSRNGLTNFHVKLIFCILEKQLHYLSVIDLSYNEIVNFKALLEIFSCAPVLSCIKVVGNIFKDSDFLDKDSLVSTVRAYNKSIRFVDDIDIHNYKSSVDELTDNFNLL